MAARLVKPRDFESYGQVLMGIGVFGLVAQGLKEAARPIHQHCFNLTGEILHLVVCLVIGEGRLLAGYVFDFQRLLDCYGMLAWVMPLVRCMLGMG